MKFARLTQSRIRAIDRGRISSVGRALDYTLFSSYKNLFYRNVEAEICGSFKINLRAESLKRTLLNLCLKS